MFQWDSNSWLSWSRRQSWCLQSTLSATPWIASLGNLCFAVSTTDQEERRTCINVGWIQNQRIKDHESLYTANNSQFLQNLLVQNLFSMTEAVLWSRAICRNVWWIKRLLAAIKYFLLLERNKKDEKGHELCPFQNSPNRKVLENSNLLQYLLQPRIKALYAKCSVEK